MKRLFIIGNGFDLSHKLKTSYNDFCKYLENACNGIRRYTPETATDLYGDRTVNYESLSGFILEIIDKFYKYEKWGDLENELPEIIKKLQDLQEELDIYEMMNIYKDKIEWERYEYRREEMEDNLAFCVPKIRELINDWIQTIDTNSVGRKKKYSKIMSEEDFYLTFNYTDTLEEVYKVKPKNICHIHGIRGKEIVFGHGKEGDLFEEKEDTPLIGCLLNYIHYELRKEVDNCNEKHWPFFRELEFAMKEKDILGIGGIGGIGGIKHIYSIGFSYTDVDLKYIREICIRMRDTTDCVWHLTKYDKKKNNIQEYENKIKECGFQGKFGGLI